MKTVGAGEAKTHFAQLLDEVERGEVVTIRGTGGRWRSWSPRPPRDPAKVAAALDAIRELSRGKHATPEEMREWIEYGRT